MRFSRNTKTTTTLRREVGPICVAYTLVGLSFGAMTTAAAVPGWVAPLIRAGKLGRKTGDQRLAIALEIARRAGIGIACADQILERPVAVGGQPKLLREALEPRAAVSARTIPIM